MEDILKFILGALLLIFVILPVTLGIILGLVSLFGPVPKWFHIAHAAAPAVTHAADTVAVAAANAAPVAAQASQHVGAGYVIFWIVIAAILVVSIISIVND